MRVCETPSRDRFGKALDVERTKTQTVGNAAPLQFSIGGAVIAGGPGTPEARTRNSEYNRRRAQRQKKTSLPRERTVPNKVLRKGNQNMVCIGGVGVRLMRLGTSSSDTRIPARKPMANHGRICTQK